MSDLLTDKSKILREFLDLLRKHGVIFVGEKGLTKAYYKYLKDNGVKRKRGTPKQAQLLAELKEEAQLAKVRKDNEEVKFQPTEFTNLSDEENRGSFYGDRPDRVEGRRAFLSLPIEERRRLLSEQIMLMDEQDREAIRDLHKLD